MDPLVEYYSQRAGEYEDIYHRNDDVQRNELAQIAEILRETFEGRRVLEVACGTGYWTSILVEKAKFVTGIDASEEMLARVKEKLHLCPNARIERGDAYHLEMIAGRFNGGAAMFWFSHMPRSRIEEFLKQFHRKLDCGARVFMADNVFVAGLGGELFRPEGSNDTFKIRKLKDGSSHRVLKNYYDEAELRKVLSPHGVKLKMHFGRAYWWVRYEVGWPA